MITCRVIVCFVLLASGLAVGAEVPEPASYPGDIADIVRIRRLDLEIMDGKDPPSIVISGNGGREGQWVGEAKVVLEAGKPEHFELLLQEKSASLQTLGLYGLAHTPTEHARALLQARLDDQTPLAVQYGCLGHETTVGELAADLAFNRNCFEQKRPVVPLLPAEVLIDHAVRAMARGNDQRRWSPYPRRLSELVQAHPALLDLVKLRQRLPDLSDAQIIKAVAQSDARPEVMQFLIRCVDDMQLALEARSQALRGLMCWSYGVMMAVEGKHRKQIQPDGHPPVEPPNRDRAVPGK